MTPPAHRLSVSVSVGPAWRALTDRALCSRDDHAPSQQRRSPRGSGAAPHTGLRRNRAIERRRGSVVRLAVPLRCPRPACRAHDLVRELNQEVLTLADTG